MKDITPRDVVFAAAGGVALIGVLLLVDVLADDSSSGATGPDGRLATAPLPATSAATAAPEPSATTEGATTTTATGSTSTSVAPSTTTTTTTPYIGEDGMAVSEIEATETDLWESIDGSCSSQPTTAVLSATLTAPSGVALIGLGWAADAPEPRWEWVEMEETAPGVYAGSVGPFDEDTLEAGTTEPILIQIEALDAHDHGVFADPRELIVLHDCETG